MLSYMPCRCVSIIGMSKLKIFTRSLVVICLLLVSYQAEAVVLEPSDIKKRFISDLTMADGKISFVIRNNTSTIWGDLNALDIKYGIYIRSKSGNPIKEYVFGDVVFQSPDNEQFVEHEFIVPSLLAEDADVFLILRSSHGGIYAMRYVDEIKAVITDGRDIPTLTSCDLFNRNNFTFKCSAEHSSSEQSLLYYIYKGSLYGELVFTGTVENFKSNEEFSIQKFPDYPEYAIVFNLVDTNGQEYLNQSNFVVGNYSIPDTCTENCHSSILFLPGIMSSRLYDGNGNKLWEPGLLSGDSDVQKLYLNQAGESIDTSIYASGVIGESINGVNIYKTFLSDLADKKSSGFINDYFVYPYDWRLSFEDILSSGTLVQSLRILAEISKSGKVTIVAHSNGGLLTKALINKLAQDAPDLIDKVIFVGVPQLGTPQTVGVLLHGYDPGVPDIVVSEERARDFAKNAPMSYQLLPHGDWHDNSAFTVSTPMISFESGRATRQLRDAYGEDIDTAEEYYAFLRGDEDYEDRDNVAYSDLTTPARVNSTLLSESINTLSSIGSGWSAPSGIEVHEVAGVGELTLSGITYKSRKRCEEAFTTTNEVSCVYEGEEYLSYTPIEVLDGDETVLEPSAQSMSETEGVKRWWVNLEEHNKPWKPNINRTHKNLLEVEDLRNLIFDNFIGGSDVYGYTYVSDTKPNLGSEDRLSFSLHSPLSLSYTEPSGIIVNAENPRGGNSVYRRYGEVQVINVFGGETGNIILDGEASGSFALDVAQIEGSDVVATVAYEAVPTVASTTATLSVSGGTIADAGALNVDYDGDGTTDLTLEPEEGEVVTPPSPTLVALIAIFKETVKSLDVYVELEERLLRKISNLGKNIETKQNRNQDIINRVQTIIGAEVAKANINTQDAELISSILNELEESIESTTFDSEPVEELRISIIALTISETRKGNLIKYINRLENTHNTFKMLTDLKAVIVKNNGYGIIDDESTDYLLGALDAIGNL